MITIFTSIPRGSALSRAFAITVIAAAVICSPTRTKAEEAKITLEIKQEPGEEAAAGPLAELGRLYAIQLLQSCSKRETGTDFAADWNEALEGSHLLVSLGDIKPLEIETRGAGKFAAREILIAGDRVLTRDGDKYAAFGRIQHSSRPDLEEGGMRSLKPPSYRDDGDPGRAVEIPGGAEEEKALGETDGAVFRIGHMLVFDLHAADWRWGNFGYKIFADKYDGGDMTRFYFERWYLREELGRSFGLISVSDYEESHVQIVNCRGENQYVESAPVFSAADRRFAAVQSSDAYTETSFSVWEASDAPKLVFRCKPDIGVWKFREPKWVGEDHVKFEMDSQYREPPLSTSVEVRLANGAWVCDGCDKLQTAK